MLEYQLVDSPAVFPSACVCGSAKGPMVDTFLEMGGMRVYLCRSCVRRSAILYGLAKGEKMDELIAASEGLERAQLEIDARNEKLAKQGEKIAELSRQMNAMRDDLETAQGEVQSTRLMVRSLHELAGQAAGIGYAEVE